MIRFVKKELSKHNIFLISNNNILVPYRSITSTIMILQLLPIGIYVFYSRQFICTCTTCKWRCEKRSILTYKSTYQYCTVLYCTNIRSKYPNGKFKFFYFFFADVGKYCVYIRDSTYTIFYLNWFPNDRHQFSKGNIFCVKVKRTSLLVRTS